MPRVKLYALGPKPIIEVSMICMKRKSSTATPVIRCKAQASMPGPPRYMGTLVRRASGRALFHPLQRYLTRVPVARGPARTRSGPSCLKKNARVIKKRLDKFSQEVLEPAESRLWMGPTRARISREQHSDER